MTSDKDYVKRMKEAQVRKEIEEIHGYVNAMSEGAEAIIGDYDEYDEESSNLLIEKLREIKEFVGNKMIEMGKNIKPATKEDREMVEMIDQIDLELKEEDVKPVALGNYLANEKVFTTFTNALSKGEITLLSVDHFKDSNKHNEQKFALTHNMAFACILHKNEGNPVVAKMIMDFENRDVSGLAIAKLMAKYKEYHQMRQQNIQTVNRVLGLDNITEDEIKQIKDNLHGYASSHHMDIAKENYDLRIEHNGFEVNSSNPKSRDEVFVDFAKEWFDQGLPDPQGELGIHMGTAQQRAHIEVLRKRNSGLSVG